MTRTTIIETLAKHLPKSFIGSAEYWLMVDELWGEVLAARVDEHYLMIAMVKSTKMNVQLREYWHAGNVRLATLLKQRGIKDE